MQLPLNGPLIYVRFTNVQCTIYLGIFVMYDLDSIKTHTYPLKTACEGIAFSCKGLC